MNAKLRNWGIGIGVCLVLGCGGFQFFLLLLGAGGPFGITWALLFGWYNFLARTLPRVTWNGSMVGMGVLCAAGVILIGQWLLRETTRHLPIAPWKWRWTLCGIAAIGVLFLVGLSIGGAFHQIGWIMSSDEPWVRERSWRPMRELESAARREFADGPGDPSSWRGGLAYEVRWHRPSVFERVQILFVLDDEGLVTGVILTPREAEERKGTYGMFISRNGDRYLRDEEEFQALIREHSAHLEAF